MQCIDIAGGMSLAIYVLVSVPRCVRIAQQIISHFENVQTKHLYRI